MAVPLSAVFIVISRDIIIITSNVNIKLLSISSIETASTNKWYSKLLIGVLYSFSLVLN